MRAATADQVQTLEALMPQRVSFSRRERSMYSHDVGTLPGLIKPFLGNSMPAGVVQPISEEEVVRLVQWAAKEKVPLVPRGKSTSGYGGVLPVRGGLVVDFVRMNGVVWQQGDEVTVQPGISWKKLDEYLNKHGLTLRLYPSSYPSSTVGGWLAQGGAGFGSWQYGWFAENVVSARVVRGDGSVRELTGQELSLTADAEGTTGLITQVTLKIMPALELSVSLAAFDTAADLTAFLASLEEMDLWSVSFVNPDMVRLSNQAPPRTHHNHPAEQRIRFPEKYLVMLAYRKDAAADGRGTVAQVIAGDVETAGGQMLSTELAEHEWAERFHIMKVKRLGPSVVPAEAVVPLSALTDVLEELTAKIRQPLALEGMGVSGDEIVLLGFIPQDQRKLGYSLTFPLYLTVAKTAKRHGGRAYSTGLYFAAEAPSVLGRERLQALRAYKAETDPAGILNPGKVLASRLSGMIGLAMRFESLLRPFGNLSKVKLEERIGSRPVKGIPPEVVWYAYSCSSCGFCVDECDQYYGRLWESQSPRGKWFYLRELVQGREKLDQEAVNTFMVCTTCELCNVMCSEKLPIEPSWLKLRELVIDKRKKMTIPPFEIMSASLDDNLNIWAYYKEDRTDWVPEDVKPHILDRGEILYFAGCTASFVENDIGQSSVRLLKDAGIEFTYMGEEESCCGIPMLVAGKWEQFGKIVEHNLTQAKQRGAKTVITSCPACWLSWSHFYKEWADKLGLSYDIDVLHYSEALQPALESGKLRFNKVNKKVTWHDSCHIGRAGGVYEPPRELIKAVPGVDFRELEHNREHGHCCGSVLTLISEPEVAHDIGAMKLEEVRQTGADEVLALCPCCEFQMRVSADKRNMDVKVTDLASFLAKARGYEVKEDLNHVLSSWATFEAMIALMLPENMADLMEELFPQLVKAMPMGMGSMMRFIGKLGPVGGLLFGVMKPLFPVLFPLLMPAMMPKVMPDMLEAVGRRVPMPEFMREQMPDLMPRAFGNLLPHMLPNVVPLISQQLVDYLRGKAPSRPAGSASAVQSEKKEHRESAPVG
ncbi:MAG: FAD-binding oxidoreductase [Spirochaetaceae bacterium]|nr:MAG: FAD-binding oxidoreductase [Spirochaetaceae bacterium]